MTTSELKSYIDRTLGNSLRCLLPSYWWKRVFGLVIDDVDSVKKSVDSKASKSEITKINTKIDALEDNIIKPCNFYVPLTLEGNQITTLTDEQIAENKASVGLVRYSGKIDDYNIRLYWYNNIKPLPLAIRSIAVIGDKVEITSNFAELDFPSEHFNFLWKHTISSDGQATSELMRNGGIELQTATTYQVTLQPNKYCKLNRTFAQLVVSLGPSSGDGVVDNYMFEFSTPAYSTSITWPDGLKWQNGQEPIIEANSTYQVSIINKLAVISVFV